MRMPPPAMGVKRVAIIAHDAASLVRFRGPLVRELAARRHRVLAVAPGLEGDLAERIAAENVAAASFPLEPPGASPFADRASARRLSALLSEFKPHIVLASGPKAAVIGARAGREAGAERVALMVNGWSALDGADAHRGLLGGGRKRLGAAMQAADIVICHNEQDRRRLLTSGLFDPRKPAITVPGSGVDLQLYAGTPLPEGVERPVFLMAGRLSRVTGADVFAAAAAALRARKVAAEFRFAGPETRGPDALSPQHIARQGAVDYLGRLDDIRPAIASAHVVVHPSASEGMAGILLEALSMGRPVVTSDIPGCREAVDERVNGVLVPPGDAQALAAAMESFVRLPGLTVAMATASRRKAERRFDQRPVVQALVEALGLDEPAAGSAREAQRAGT